MIKKEREIPPRLKSEEALLRRLPPTHPKRKEISKNLSKIRAGLKGEKELDYHLTFLPEKDTYIFQNLHLPGLQMDTLLLCPPFALIIESKNIYGTLNFDPETHQMIRTYEGQKEGFPDPILQVKRQQHQLQKLISLHKIKPFPIHGLVAIGFPSTIIETPRSNNLLFDTLLHAERIPEKIQQLRKNSSESHLSAYLMNKLSDLLLSQHQLPENPDILKSYQIAPHELITGIACPGCSRWPMERIHAAWKCKACGCTSSEVYEQVVRDHLQIYGQITREECQKLLHLPSPYMARRILTAMKLPYKGTTKGRIYLNEKAPE